MLLLTSENLMSFIYNNKYCMMEAWFKIFKFLFRKVKGWEWRIGGNNRCLMWHENILKSVKIKEYKKEKDI